MVLGMEDLKVNIVLIVKKSRKIQKDRFHQRLLRVLNLQTIRIIRIVMIVISVIKTQKLV